jgi:hypothetical protein
VLERAMAVTDKPIKKAVCDHGYRGKRQIGETSIILPGAPLKRDNHYQRGNKRKCCRRRAAIEPLSGYLKSDHRLGRCFLKGSVGGAINLLMPACAWNLKKRLLVIFWLLKKPVLTPEIPPCHDNNEPWSLIMLSAALMIVLAVSFGVGMTNLGYPC